MYMGLSGKAERLKKYPFPRGVERIPLKRISSEEFIVRDLDIDESRSIGSHFIRGIVVDDTFIGKLYRSRIKGYKVISLIVYGFGICRKIRRSEILIIVAEEMLFGLLGYESFEIIFGTGIEIRKCFYFTGVCVKEVLDS